MRLAFIASANYRASSKILAFDESKALADAFFARGVTLDIVDPQDAAVDWRRYAAVLPLGYWGYYHKPQEFRDLIERLSAAGIPLVNSPEILRWNLDKSYLLDLREAGVTVAPLLYFAAGSQPNLFAAVASLGKDRARYVLKPAISAGAFSTLVAEGEPTPEVLALARKILDRSGLLLQPFCPEVPETGEWSLMFSGNTLSHAVLKVPKPGDFRSQPDHGATVTRTDPPPEIIRQAQAAIAAAPGRPAYARVDGFLRDGKLHLIELELIEPCLFLQNADTDTPAKFCDAILHNIPANL